MIFSSNSSKLTGVPDESGWSQVYDFLAEDPRETNSEGHVYVVLGMKNGQEGVSSVIAGREIFSFLQKEYFEIPNTVSLGSVKKLTEKIIEKFGLQDNLQIAIVVHFDNFVYLIAGGGAKICLVRGGRLVSVVDSIFQKVVSASGLIKKGDTFLIATSAFFKKIDVNLNLKVFDSSNTELAIECFAPLVHELKTSGDIGLSVINFSETIGGERNSIPSPEFLVDSTFKKIDDIDTAKDIFEPPQDLNKSINITKKKFDSSFLKKIFERQLYVDNGNYDPEIIKKRKNSALVGILLLILLTISISFGIKQKKLEEQKNNYDKELSAAKHNIEEAQNLVDLNPERSRELFTVAREKVLGLSTSGIKNSELDNLKKNIDSVQGKVLGEYVAEPELYVDLGLLSDGFVGSEVITTNGQIYVLDKDSKKVVKIAIDNKRSEVVAGPSKVNNNSQLLAYSDNLYIADEGGVFDVSGNRKKIIDNTWQGEILPYSYSGNIYIVEKQISKIWRYAPGMDKFSDAKSWLAEENKADFSNAKSIVIDGSIWILTTDGNILKFTSGNQQRFRVPSDFSKLKPEYAFTGDEVGYLYLLDKVKGRIIVLTKDGVYKAQYITAEIKNTTRFVVLEKAKKIILLNGNKLLSIDLKHL